MTTLKKSRLFYCLLGTIGIFAALQDVSAGKFKDNQQPILVVGSSFASGKTPFDGNGGAPLGGTAVNLGSFLSLGEALTFREEFVVNEAQAGSTTFARNNCLADFCLPVGWESYETQLTKVLARVAIRNPNDPTRIIGYNASYVFIGIANDCLHSDSFGLPQSQTSPCSATEIDEFVDRIVALAMAVEEVGMTPIIPEYPAYDDLDLELTKQRSGFSFIVNEAEWDQIATTYAERVKAEVPNALFLGVWTRYDHLPDGLHPTPKTSIKAAKRVIKAIKRHRRRHRR